MPRQKNLAQLLCTMSRSQKIPMIIFNAEIDTLQPPRQQLIYRVINSQNIKFYKS